jgi:hypothetical protein
MSIENFKNPWAVGGFYPNKKIWFWEYGIDAYLKN